MIIIGSRYFFSNYSDFEPHDTDKIEIIETEEFKGVRHIKQIKGKKRCYFQVKKQKLTQDYIDDALKSDLGMVVGKFLVPEFCQEINFTINDLPKLKPLIDILDERHKYEEIIYNAYLENGSFILTEKQRDEAYNLYKKSRKK